MKVTKLIFVVLFTAIFLAACVQSPAPSQSSPQPAQTQQTSVKTSATPAAKPVVEEVKGEISLDRNFYLIIDGSDSMNEKEYAGNFPSKINGAKWATKEFLKVVPDDVNLGLYVFDRRGQGERVSLGKNNREKIIAAVDAISANSGTPLNQAIIDGTDALMRQKNLQLGYGEFNIVVVTDGEATDGSTDYVYKIGKQIGTNIKRFDSETSVAVAYATKYGVSIITIGFGLKADHPLKKGSLSYRNATNPAELLQALKETQAESTYFDSTVFESLKK